MYLLQYIRPLWLLLLCLVLGEGWVLGAGMGDDPPVINQPFTVNISPDTIICKGMDVALKAEGPAGSAYSWSPASYLSRTTGSSVLSKARENMTYTVTVTDTNGKVAQAKVTIWVDLECVLSGDADHDGRISIMDAIPISLGQGHMGPRRKLPVDDGVPVHAPDWLQNVDGINAKHCDCNADGLIDQLDLLCLQNKLQEVYADSSMYSYHSFKGVQNAMPVKMVFDKEYYIAGDTVHMDLQLGAKGRLPVNISALAGRLHFRSDFCQPLLYSSHPVKDLFENYNAGLYLMYDDRQDLSTAFGVANAYKLPPANAGIIAQFSLVLKDSTANYSQSGELLLAFISEIKAVDAEGKAVDLHIISDSVKVYRNRQDAQDNTNIAPVLRSQQPQVFPNPASSEFVIQAYPHSITGIRLYNLQGVLVRQLTNPQGERIYVALEDLSPGVYMLAIDTKTKTLMQKLIIAR